MKPRFLTPTLIILVLVVIFFTAVAASAGIQEFQQAVIEQPTANESLVAGNYCVSCHLAEDERLALVTVWDGNIEREASSPCPAATKAREEVYYTERMLLMIERAKDTTGALPEANQAKLDGYTQRFSRLLDTPPTSLDAFVSEAQTTRYQLNKVYTLQNEMIEADKGRAVLIYASIATLIVLGSLAWGTYNTRTIRASLLDKRRVLVWRVAFILAVLVFFALPIFRVPAAEVLMTTAEQQAAQTVLDTAQRAADAGDRAQARAWMLATIGAEWSQADDAQAQALLDEAYSAVEVAAQNEEALWGQSLAVQEVTIGTQVEMETASLIAKDLNATRAHDWALPLIAIEWKAIDHEKAALLLQQEQKTVQNQSGLYRDLQLRGLALAWAQVEPSQAAPVAGEIADPMLRAWTLRELASLVDGPALYQRAVESAEQIQDPIQKARALREIASASGQSELFDQALITLQDASSIPLAYALSDLAAASGDASLVEMIDPAYVEARTSALLRMGHYEAAWNEAANILDPYEAARAQSTIASSWKNAQAAQQIEVPLYRDLALRDIVRKTGDATLVDSISLPYYKVQALVAIGDLEAAQGIADQLSEPYPLVELALALADSDPQAAQALVDKMTREADKAIALRAIAVASQEPTYLEQAKGMALASRIRGDALAPALVSIELAQAFWELDPAYAMDVLQQAYEATLRIAVK